MKGVRLWLLVAGLFLVLFAQTVSVEAAAHLSWTTTELSYGEGGRLNIRGYFTNDGDYTIDRIDRISFTVTVSAGKIAEFTVSNFDLYLEPGDTKNWHFWANYADAAPLVNWRVRYRVNYHYLQ